MEISNSIFMKEFQVQETGHKPTYYEGIIPLS
jgi:hypothetical protein